MDNVLIISSSEGGIDALSQMLKAEYKSVVTVAKNGSEGRIMLSGNDYDLIFINLPLSDESGDSLAEYAAERSSAAILMLVKAELERQFEDKFSQNGVFVLAKPINKYLLVKSLRFIDAMSRRMKIIHDENVRLQRKIDDTRLVNRAKGILMEYFSMTEPQAHKYLERQAMDLRISKTEVAKRLLSTYEN